MQSETDWLDDFLPLMRCPDTHQPLRRATPEECAMNQVTAALATEDGTRVFVIDDGIPILLPKQG
ncbi:hypothetical protein [Prosthecobacter sp.]|uniref:hypothetical protein n=1 Tax=Prosthecobacter sp. TaxID=1965333 RepID=UPI003784E884